LKNILETQKNSPGPDDIHSLVKDEFTKLIKSIREIEETKGNGIKIPTDSERKNLLTNRVSIISLVDIKHGEAITKDMVDIKRPGTGIQPIHFDKIIGMRAKMDIPKDEPITFDMLS